MFPLKQRVEVPRAGHPGSFGFQRKNHIHEGVDLYAPDGTPVYAIRNGLIAKVYQFTGEAVGMPWWHDTWAIAVIDPQGYWVYGEIAEPVGMQVGDYVSEGQQIGTIKQVLKVDKGRPVSMVHIERWRRTTKPYTMLWELGQPQPDFLVDPTDFLIKTEDHSFDF